ncbi:MAG TPA: DUF3780 domain-containing protein [Lentisphaeria bacterium]|nr:MAG: hypothetical protein A2X47_06005 [Lentisphaerae bacterium GWF2_38_69]HBM14778.1 DUF3780 domain-containing protein [Lentisphaeria bacterium]
MTKPKEQIGFGFNPSESKHHFLVIIPKSLTAKVQIYERFEWGSEEENPELLDEQGSLLDLPEQKIDQRFDRLKCEISRNKWKEVEAALRIEFNCRLKEHGYKTAAWKQGQNVLQRLFGKELTLLCWAIEDCEIRLIPTAIKNWQGLKPEERWWLYTMTNASTGEVHTKYGWRVAIRYALTENPITDKLQQVSLFDQFFNDSIEINRGNK